MNKTKLGWLAIFDSPDSLMKGGQALRQAGIKISDIYSPYAVEEVFPLLERKRDGFRWLPARFREVNVLGVIALVAGLSTALFVFLIQSKASTWPIPANIGGRPLFSWPNYIPVTFVLAILLAGCAIFFGFLVITGLPEPYHALFNSPSFNLSTDKFYLFIASEDLGEPSKLTGLLSSIPHVKIEEVT